MDKKQTRLGEILIDKGLINSEQLKYALEEQKRTKEFLGAILLKNNQIEEKALLEALSEQFHIPFVSIKNKYIDWNLVKRFSSSLILDYKCFPIEEDGRSVTFATTNPLDVWAFKKSEEEASGSLPKFVLVTREDMEDIIQRYQQYMRSNISRLFE
jgi:inorganic pyrophosphatase/exopolyphosphatase